MKEKKPEGPRQPLQLEYLLGINLTRSQFQDITDYQISVDKLNRAKKPSPKTSPKVRTCKKTLLKKGHAPPKTLN